MFESQNIKVLLVAVNYNFTSPKEFAEKLETTDILNRYKLHLQDVKFDGSGTLPPQPILDDIRAMIPFVYVSEDTTVKVSYTHNEFKLYIEKSNLSDDNFNEYQNLSNEIVDFKLSDITAIGINYSAEFNLGKNKLKLLSDKTVSSISDFDKNTTFELILPISYPERGLVATYRIKKISGGDNTEENRIYEIRVNFHFDLNNKSTVDKAKNTEEIISQNLYKEFLAKCEQILSVNNE